MFQVLTGSFVMHLTCHFSAVKVSDEKECVCLLFDSFILPDLH